jgi:hypothetical protein
MYTEIANKLGHKHADAAIQEKLSKNAFQLMMKQMINIHNKKEWLKVKNELTFNGTREGQPPDHLTNE